MWRSFAALRDLVDAPVVDNTAVTGDVAPQRRVLSAGYQQQSRAILADNQAIILAVVDLAGQLTGLPRQGHHSNATIDQLMTDLDDLTARASRLSA